MVWDIGLACHTVLWYGISDFSPIPFWDGMGFRGIIPRDGLFVGPVSGMGYFWDIPLLVSI